MRPWRCSECGCTPEAAERKRKRLGLRNLYLMVTAVTCTPECGRRRARWMRPIQVAARGRRILEALRRKPAKR